VIPGELQGPQGTPRAGEQASPFSPRVDDDLVFRSLAAPGLDEDDLLAAIEGLPGGLLWGAGRPSAFRPADGEQPWSAEEERRRHHAEVLSRWPVHGAAAAGGQGRGRVTPDS
jgi:hypothetical protein